MRCWEDSFRYPPATSIEDEHCLYYHQIFRDHPRRSTVRDILILKLELESTSQKRSRCPGVEPVASNENYAIVSPSDPRANSSIVAGAMF